MLDVVRAVGLVTVQDRGWDSGRAVGLPQSGALDLGALIIGNALVGNDPAAAGLEVVGGSLTVRATTRTVIAITGGVGARVGDGAVPRWRSVVVEPGSTVTIGTGASQRVGYLAVAGGIDVAPTLGARATYLPTGIGGFHGRRLGAGDQIPVGLTNQSYSPKMLAVEPDVPGTTSPIRVVAGPQAYLFDEDALARLVRSEWTVSPTSDRMGSRLVGPSIAPRIAASLPSEATCLGAIQIPDDGQPIVLLADGPTVGGYPKVGAVISADLGRFAQLGPGSRVHFSWVTIAEAATALAEWSGRLATAVVPVQGRVP